MPRSPEEAARESVLQGDVGAALTLLMESYGREIFRHCYQVLGDRELAADVHQTVFVQAYRDLTRFDGRSSFRTWLYSIARHRCLDAIKMRRRWRLRFFLGSAEREIDPTPSVREVLEEHADARAVEGALQTLKPEVRIAVLLRYREEMSFEEMASVCGVRATTLQARVARALPKLRKALEKHGGSRD